MISLDTEVTGIDLRHGAKPFIVTTCDEEGVQRFWVWDVDPMTREPIIPVEDLIEISKTLREPGQRFALQNGKFDYTALGTLDLELDWAKVDDTLVTGHILASNMPHDLTSMSLQYLDEDIEPWEARLQAACNEARRLCRTVAFQERHGVWRIAAEGLPEMPSAKSGSKKDDKGIESESPWKFDAWLPRAVAKAEGYWKGVPLVISGGQNGVDQAALRAAKAAGIETGGTAPAGWRTLDGPCGELERFGLVEDSSPEYKPRTWKNVKDASATLMLWENPSSPGEICTRNAVRFHCKLVKEVDLRTADPEEVAKWIMEECGSINVAGNSERTCPGIGQRAEEFLTRVFELCRPHPWWTVCQEYANKDSEVTLPLWQVMERELERRGLMNIYRAKMASIPSVLDMERRGATFSSTRTTAMIDEYDQEIAAAEAKCKGIARSRKYRLELPKSGNNGSLSEFCFGPDLLNLPQVKWTKTGKPAFDKEVIEEYRRTLDGDQLEFVKSLSAARKRQKSNEFLRSYQVFGVPGPGEMLVLHPSANPTATATTRFSMSNPNLQQVSKQESLCETCEGDGCDECDGTGEDLHSVRKVFGPGPGREWWTADAENIELRLPAYESGEPELIALFERPNDPPFYGSQHLLNFSVVFEDVWRRELAAVGLEKVGPHVKKKHKSTFYQWTKNGDFALQYQCGEETADKSFHRIGSYRKLKEKFSRLESLNQQQVRFAKRHGWVETMPDRSVDPKRGYPLLCSRYESGQIKDTVPLNYHTQGTAGWWMVRAMTRCHAKMLEWKASSKGKWDGFIALTVHDELVFDFPKVAGPLGNRWRMKILKGLMEQGGKDVGVPTPVSVTHCPDNWADGEVVSL